MSRPRRAPVAKSSSRPTKDARASPAAKKRPAVSGPALRQRVAELERELAAVRSERDELRVDEMRWRRLAEQCPLGIIAYRPDGTVKYANRALMGLFELTEEEHAMLLAKYNILHDPTLRASGTMEHIEKAFAGEVAVLPPVMYERASPIEKHPVRRWLEGLMYSVRDREGAIREVVLIHKDITPLRSAEEDLRASRDLLRHQLAELEHLYATAPVGLCLVDRDLRYVRINEMMAAFNGSPPSDHLGRTVREVLPELADHIEPVYRRVIETAEPALDVEVHGVTAAEPRTEKDWLVRFHPLLSEDGSVEAVSTVVQDITHRKRQEEEHRRFESRVQHAQKLESLGVLAGGIAHDFNNLLMGILGNADVALAKLAPESPGREALERIKVASKRAAELTNQMLAYSGRTRFQVEPLDLNRIVEEMMHLLRAVISKKARLQLELASELPLIEADAAQVRQVVMNLITNASDALGGGVGVIRVTTSLVDAGPALLAGCDVGERQAPGLYVSLEVADDGMGMNNATRERMFDPFFTTKFTGRGLGLAAVLGIVRGHEAVLRVDSESGQGTRFTVLFPASGAVSPATSPPADAAVVAAGEGATILVVDDEPTIREVAAQLLEEAGYRVLLARDGREGVDVLREHAGEIDLVLLDMTMPGLSGTEALDQMCRVEPGVRVLLSSGYTQPDTEDLSSAENLAGFIQKPYGAELLARKVADALGRSRS